MGWLLICGLLAVSLVRDASAQLPLGAESLNRSAMTATEVPPPAAMSFREGRRSAMADSCVTSDGGAGTCMTRFNCMRKGGSAKGFCATYGVCCETNMLCNQVSKLKRTLIKNPVQLTESTCRYTIEAYSSNVCQLLVELQQFELQQPSVDPLTGRLECGDNFVAGKFALCGVNSQQHLYLPFSVASGIDVASLVFNLPNRWSGSNWRLVVTQLECPAAKRRHHTLMPFVSQNSLQDLRTIFTAQHSDLDLLAPPGCDQYHTQTSGTIRSFNYNEALASTYLSNLNYAICVKPAPGATTIEYTVRRFSLSSEIAAGGYDSFCHSTIHTAGRREDFLMIPQSMLANNPDYQPTYYCGSGVLPTNQVIYASAPFVMVFGSDDIWDATETGFSIDYAVKTTI